MIQLSFPWRVRLVACVVLFAVLWFAGVGPVFGIVAAAALFALVTIYETIRRQPTGAWRQRRVSPHQGARMDLSFLSWSITNNDNVLKPVTVDRLHAVVDARLARRGLSLAREADRSAIDALLGRQATDILTRAPLTGRDALALISALDVLGADPDSRPNPRKAQP